MNNDCGLEGCNCGYRGHSSALDRQRSEFGSALKRQAVDVRTEADPTGKAQNEPGAKLDAGKIIAADVFQMFARALTAVAEVGTAGAKKYTLGGWQSVPDGFRRYSNAQMRHLLAEWKGEAIDQDTGQFHAACVAWNALARLELLLRQMGPERIPDSV